MQVSLNEETWKGDVGTAFQNIGVGALMNSWRHAKLSTEMPFSFCDKSFFMPRVMLLIIFIAKRSLARVLGVWLR